jgi:hypothetical protein
MLEKEVNKRSKTMKASDSYIAEATQKDLAAGVLKQVAQDLRRFHGATSAVERELYRDAYRWLVSEDTSWPFSFLNVCQVLNVAPETLRDDLLRDQSLGMFGYCVRRCGHAAHRFQIFLSTFFSNERNASAVTPGALGRVAP